MVTPISEEMRRGLRILNSEAANPDYYLAVRHEYG